MENMFSKNKFKDFVKWYRSPNTPLKKMLKAPSYNQQQSVEFENFTSNLKNTLEGGETIDVILHGQLPQGEFTIDCVSKDNCDIDLFSLQCNAGNTAQLLLTNLRISNFTIVHANYERLTILNCDIKKLTLQGGCKVTLKGCRIGQINFNDVTYLHIEKGFILDFICPVPGGINPFTGSISLNKTFIPRDTKNYLLNGPQPYRNIRHHLKSIENGQLANFFHSAELAVERENDTFFNKIISHAYESFSDFGASALRPLIWWFIIGLSSALLIYYFDGAVTAYSLDSEHYTGWRNILICNNEYRSVYLSFQSMLNPLGVLGIKSLVIPAFGWLVTYLLIQGLFSAILIALMIFAIRRRFKISS